MTSRTTTPEPGEDDDMTRDVLVRFTVDDAIDDDDARQAVLAELRTTQPGATATDDTSSVRVRGWTVIPQPPAEPHDGGWMPADLVAVSTLRALLAADPANTRRLLDGRARQHLEEVLFAGDHQVRVLDPQDPGGPEIYEGPATEAHQWIPPGTYRATGMDGAGKFRLVVGRCRIGDTMTASAAFPPAEHDSAILNQIARVLEDASEELADPQMVLMTIDTLVTSTGRVGGGGETLTGPGALLSELLTDREQQIGPEERDSAGGPYPDGPGRAR